MAGFKIHDFRGLSIARDPRLLDGNEATLAQGLLFDGSGTLRGFDNPWKVVHNMGAVFPDPYTLYRYVSPAGAVTWLKWSSKDVEVAEGPVEADIYGRVIITNDGAPKMTHSGIVPTTRPLGIPAPATKCTTTTDTPTTTLAGAIEELTCSSLKMIHEVLGSEGRNSGYNATQVVATTTPVKLTCLQPGSRFKVATVTDVDHVTITGIGDASFAAIVDKQNYGLKWGAPSNENLWRRRKKAYWNFLVPTGATLKITNHGLEPGDIIQVTAASDIMSWEFATMNTTPITNQSTRTATIAAGGNITFTGNCNFIVDRGGETIDPLVPNQNYDIQLRSYVYTYLTSIDEESAPSPTSDSLTVYTGNDVTVTSFASPPAGYSINRIRLYRTNTGTDGTEFQLVDTFATGTTSYVDSKPDEELAEVLPSEMWAVPDATMRGIVTMPNGMMAAYIPSKKAVCFCEPGYPHAWPEDYQYALEHEPVTLAVFGDSLFVGTKGQPYIFQGSHPRQMAWRRVPMTEPALGAHSAVSIGDRIAYVSPNGVIVVGADGASNLTLPYISPERWRGFFSTDTAGFNVKGYYYGNTLEFVQHSDTSQHLGVVAITLNDGRVDISYVTRADTASYVDPSTHKLYRANSDFANTYVQELDISVKQDDVSLSEAGYWDGTTSSLWHSKRFEMRPPTNLAWARVEFEYTGDADPAVWTFQTLSVTFRFRLPNKEEVVFTKPLVSFAEPDSDDQVFRLPKGFVTESLIVEVDFSEHIGIKSIRFGETIEDVLD